ncbi:MAG: DNA polymerase III subunit gamma/tau [Tissierellia bacterium]|nr:DNA polymerase III subunit gamma/tau [Tissierellia bacterium]
MYQAIYRAFRPQTFDEVIGQEPIIEVLKNQVQSGKIGHAYLFSGTRGTGKTSCAKILSRAVNCLTPINGNPCNECASCRGILEETNLDVIEMDAASNRRIDDIRDLRDKVIYPPAALKYKVYIIDEAHMITNEGFNALLKIMEEPPRHLIFILATTELEKIPATILSRCQRFEFKRISQAQIEGSLAGILEDLGRSADPAAIEMIARAAGGGMRDAQSILDQALSAGEGQITLEQVAGILGLITEEDMGPLLGAIFEQDYEGALLLAEEKLAAGITAADLVNALTETYRGLLLAKTAPEMLTGDEQLRNSLIFYGAKYSFARIADCLEVLIETKSKLRLTEAPEAMLQVGIVRLIEQTDRKALLSRIDALERRLEEFLAQGPREAARGTAVQSTPKGRVSHGNGPSPVETDGKSEEKEEEIPSEEAVSRTGKRGLTKDKTPPEPPMNSPSSSESQNEPALSAHEKMQQILDNWEACVEFMVSKKRFWGMWLGDLTPMRLVGGVLYLNMAPSQLIGYKKAVQGHAELQAMLQEYYKMDFTIELTKQDAGTDPSEQAKSDLDVIYELFGKDNVQVKKGGE